MCSRCFVIDASSDLISASAFDCISSADFAYAAFVVFSFSVADNSASNFFVLSLDASAALIVPFATIFLISSACFSDSVKLRPAIASCLFASIFSFMLAIRLAYAFICGFSAAARPPPADLAALPSIPDKSFCSLIAIAFFSSATRCANSTDASFVVVLLELTAFN